MDSIPRGIPAIENNLPLLMKAFGITERQIRQLPAATIIAGVSASVLANHWDDLDALLNPPGPPETR